MADKPEEKLSEWIINCPRLTSREEIAEKVVQLEAELALEDRNIPTLGARINQLEADNAALQRQVERLQEFYDAHCGVEDATVDLTLHKAHVERFRLARIALVEGDNDGQQKMGT